MKKEKKLTFTNIISAIVVAVLIISFAVVFTLNFKPLYYASIGHLDIPSTSGFDKEKIIENYDALINYNFLFFRGELEFPSLPMSEYGKIHFEEVKVIFDGIQIILIAAFALCIILFFYKFRKKPSVFVRIGSAIAVVMPIVLGSIIAMNWEFFFVKFHELFFDNDYWIFDATTDPVIMILPDEFFMYCAIMILVLIVVVSVVLFTIEYKHSKKLR